MDELADGRDFWVLELLGGFRLRRDGEIVRLPLGGQRLVAFLALHNRSLQRLFVAGKLWTDSSEERACANLRTTLWRLQAVGCPLVAVSGGSLTLVPELAVDIHDSNADARRVLSQGVSGTRVPADLARWLGELLPDWYDDWVVVEREHHRQLSLNALERVCEELMEAGAYAASLEAGLACVAAEPLRESAHRAVIQAHLAAGNSSEAVRQYRLFRHLVLDRLGIEPSSRMLRVLQSIPTESVASPIMAVTPAQRTG